MSPFYLTRRGFAKSASSIKPWNAAEARSFLTHVANDEFLAAWILALTTGMRRAEILGLGWEDIDFDRAQLSIRQTLVNVANEVKVSSPKTVRSRRSLALDTGTLEHSANIGRGRVSPSGRSTQPTQGLCSLVRTANGFTPIVLRRCSTSTFARRN